MQLIQYVRLYVGHGTVQEGPQVLSVCMFLHGLGVSPKLCGERPGNLPRKKSSRELMDSLMYGMRWL